MRTRDVLEGKRGSDDQAGQFTTTISDGKRRTLFTLSIVKESNSFLWPQFVYDVLLDHWSLFCFVSFLTVRRAETPFSKNIEGSNTGRFIL